MVVPQCPPRRESFFLPSTQLETGLRRDRTAQRGRSLVIPRTLVQMLKGEAPL